MSDTLISVSVSSGGLDINEHECKEVDCQLCDDDYTIPDQPSDHAADCQLHDDE